MAPPGARAGQPPRQPYFFRPKLAFYRDSDARSVERVAGRYLERTSDSSTIKAGPAAVHVRRPTAEAHPGSSKVMIGMPALAPGGSHASPLAETRGGCVGAAHLGDCGLLFGYMRRDRARPAKSIAEIAVELGREMASIPTPEKGRNACMRAAKACAPMYRFENRATTKPPRICCAGGGQP